MKKFTLVISIILAGSLAFGQHLKVSEKYEPYSAETTVKTLPPGKQLKGEGDVFYLQTFDFADPSSPQGWSMPEGWIQNDYTEYGHQWVWRAGTDSIRGWFTYEKGHIYSETPDDGFWVFPIDEYNYRDGVRTLYDCNSDFQMAPVDCSGRPSVIFRMNQHFRYCCSGSGIVSMYVSNDQGVHWAEFSMKFGATVNNFGPRPRVEVNISEVAAGMPDVWIKFVFSGHRHYFWAIDDISLSEGFVNEIQLEDAWQYFNDNDNNDDDGFIYMTPFSQLGTNGFGSYTFKGAVLNFGMDDAYSANVNVEVFKNGASVYNSTSESRTIWPIDRDTFLIDEPFMPDEIGDYRIVMTAGMEQEDGAPANNVYEDSFYITDSIYSVGDWDNEEHASTAGNGNNDGDQVGVVYDINQETEANSISVLITQRQKNPRASTQPGMFFQYWLWRYDIESQSYIEVIPSDFTEVTEEMINAWVTLPLEKDGESEFLIPGEYIATIQTYHNGGEAADNNFFRFTVGADFSHKYHPQAAAFLLNNDATWYQLGNLPMIRLNINEQGAPAEADVVFNVDMTLPISEGIFNPGSDFVDVAGSFNGWEGSGHMTDDDGDGVYSLIVPGISTFSVIEYKYRINGNWDTSEFPFGGPNRVYRTTYWNMLDDIYNDGLSTVGIDSRPAMKDISIYPNPCSGMFTVSVVNPSGENLEIVITNIHGQVVFREDPGPVTSHTGQINISDFSRGLYFLKVGNEVKKIILK